MASPKKIIFVHPDLGIGGAERLIIDAAVGLQSTGHKVTVFTSYRDKNHCFEEARDGTLDVRVRGDAIFPPTLGGRFHILFSILRQVALVLSIALFSSELNTVDPDLIIVDQLSACIPLFRIFFPKAKVLFYGHYPDRLLAKPGTSLPVRVLKRLYRRPFDIVEGWSTSCADLIVVNSKFTRSVYKKTFAGMRLRELKVIYPCVDTQSGDAAQDATPLWPDKKVLLSINRFEGKKEVALAIRAFAGLSAHERSQAKLVIAGGYDPRSQENAATHKALQKLAKSLELTHATYQGKDASEKSLSSESAEVIFLLSIPHALKERLLHTASILVYTPRNEHFGIVPLEAMLAEVPVLATNTGGPLETIYDGRTGWLRSADKVAQWTEIMRKPLIPSSADSLRTMGQRGRERVLAEFSQTKMTESLNAEVQRLTTVRLPRTEIVPNWLIGFLLVVPFCILAALVAWGLTALAIKYEDKLVTAGFGNNVSAAVTTVAEGVKTARDEL